VQYILFPLKKIYCTENMCKNDKIVPLTNLNKCINNDKSYTEVPIPTVCYGFVSLLIGNCGEVNLHLVKTASTCIIPSLS